MTAGKAISWVGVPFACLAVAATALAAESREPSTEAKAGHAVEDAKDESNGSPGDLDEEFEDEDAETREQPAASDEVRYTKDITDAELLRRWKEEPASLGSMSVGVARTGRLLNGVQFPDGKNWIVVEPAKAWGTRETVDFIVAAVNAVAEKFPGTHPMRINHMSRRDGGYIRPHKTHQSGRDVDLGFYTGGEEARAGIRLESMDLPRNWALVKAFITLADVEAILINRKGAKKIYDFACSIGEDRAWLNRVFNAGEDSIVKGVRRHRDHFHVRFYNARAQELGRRIQPHLGKGQDDRNFVVHHVRKGDTLGQIARKYHSTVQAIKKENGMKSTALRVGRALNVPIKGPCVNCPVPPPLVVPPRRFPPDSSPAALAAVPAAPPEGCACPSDEPAEITPSMVSKSPVAERMILIKMDAFLPTVKLHSPPPSY
ncbi:MAG: penicillin-insensitive murein endopeptidase [Deltaproteobacteria bacterium]|nr:penicillin-insensitive murein endopeptidase [Deltaproteobacteria bacterium]